MSRGYFGIGAEGISKAANMGALMRTAHAFGASFCFSIGAGYGIYGGQSAVALRGGYTTPDGHWNLGGAVSTGFASSHDIGGSVHGDYIF